VAGCDEAGRGPLAGPVVAAAVVLDPKRIPKGIDDSKRLTAERREELFEEICATASFAVAFASPARIDRDNILRASLWALARAGRRAARDAEACVRRRPRQDRRPLRLRCGDRRLTVS
jgi:ribonuclease HII